MACRGDRYTLPSWAASGATTPAGGAGRPLRAAGSRSEAARGGEGGFDAEPCAGRRRRWRSRCDLVARLSGVSRPVASFAGLIWPRVALRARSPARNGVRQLFSPAAARHSSRDKIAAARRSPLCCDPSGAGRSPPACRSPSRPHGAALRDRQEITSWPPSAPSPSTATALLKGQIKTLNLSAEVSMEPVESRQGRRSRLPPLRRRGRARRGLGQDGQGERSRIPPGPARRSLLSGPDLREPHRATRIAVPSP